MDQPIWNKLLLPQANEDLVFELFHENSKVGRYGEGLSKEEVRARMADFHESLPFEGYPIVELPTSLPYLNAGLTEVITGRISARDLVPKSVSIDHLAAILHLAYGVIRSNVGTSFPRPFRVIPSGGALYPLEIFFHTAQLEGQRSGLYHYNPSKNHLRLLQEGDATERIAQAMVQPEIGRGASLLIFITAIFERSVFKYGDRGYRFIFLETGHVAQNINLVATALGFGCVNIGGFFDREIDDFLDLDGVTHSTVYMIAVGGK